MVPFVRRREIGQGWGEFWRGNSKHVEGHDEFDMSTGHSGYAGEGSGENVKLKLTPEHAGCLYSNGRR